MRYMTGIMNHNPPGPPKKLFKLLGDARGTNTYLLDLLEEYGPVFSLDLGQQGQRTVFIGHPNYVRELFRTNKENLVGNNKKVFKMLGENSVFSLTGEEHIHTRKILGKSLFTDQIENHVALTEQVVHELDYLWPKESVVSVRSVLLNIYQLVIKRMIFGDDRDHLSNEVIKNLSNLLDISFHLSPVMATIALNFDNTFTDIYTKKLTNKFDNSIYKAIDEIRKESNLEDRLDIVSRLICSEDFYGNKLTNKQIRDHLITIIVAGHESNSTQTSFLLEQLAHNKNIQEAAREDNDLLERSIKETMRLKPGLRYAQKVVKNDFELLDFNLKAGQIIMIGLYLIHLNESVWSDPFKFNPERFVNPLEDNYAWIPFGVGVHRCLGSRLAPLQIATVTKELLQKYEFIPIHKEERVMNRAQLSAPQHGAELLVKVR